MTRRLLLAACLAAPFASAAAVAQPFRSDNTGPIITGSGVGAGWHTAPGFRDIENALFRGVRGRTAFRNRTVADAMLGTARELGRAVCEGTLQPRAGWPAALPLDTAAQRVVCGVAEERPDSTTAWLLHTLTGGIPGRHVAPAEALVASLHGLFRGDPEPLDSGGRWVDGGRLHRAIAAYEAYLSAAPPALLDPPPAELAVIGAVLQEVVRTGLAVSR